MPKVSKLKKGEASTLVEAVPMALGRESSAEQSGEEPMKPVFQPLSAFEQNGSKIEFRRVRALLSSVQRSRSRLAAVICCQSSICSSA